MADPTSLLAAVGTLAVDATAAEVTATFAARGIPCLLLRGPALAFDLYDPGEVRDYGDVDLLVPSGRWEDATAALTATGRHWPLAAADRIEVHDTHAQTWVRGGAPAVDLHRHLSGMPSSDAYALVRGTGRTLRLAGRDVVIGDRPGVALVVALHAAQHGRGDARTLEDLRRAIRRLPPGDWAQAAARAQRGSGAGPFWLGLTLLPEGRALADTLGLEAPPTSVHARLLADSPPPVAPTLEVLARTPLRAWPRYLARKLVPTPATMRATSQLARRGRRGLALAYALRLDARVRDAGAGWRAWRRAARGGR